VLGFSELLTEALENENAAESVKASLRGLRIGAKHLQSVLGDLLDLSRLESGVVETHAEWTDLTSFLEDLDDLFRTRFKRRSLEFLVAAPEGPAVELWIDPGRLSQILSNLLSNALRFTKRGWVALRVAQRGASWEFAVEDTGVGIPADQQRTIFEPFVQKQGQNEQHFGGTGLGLAICRTLAQSLGGRLGLQSEVSSGSRFTLTFDQLPFRPEACSSFESFSSSLPKMTLLIADDERTNFLLVQGFLKGTPVNLLTAGDGVEAVELWKQHRPRIVLMDLRMPSLSGWEAARRIRALDTQGQTCLLAMSATSLSPSEAFEGRGIWSGFLEKPFTKKDFLKFLSNHITIVD
jgi:CheY-like chemotaxis protein